jgi:hypothetical protein
LLSEISIRRQRLTARLCSSYRTFFREKYHEKNADPLFADFRFVVVELFSLCRYGTGGRKPKGCAYPA